MKIQKIKISDRVTLIYKCIDGSEIGLQIKYKADRACNEFTIYIKLTADEMQSIADYWNHDVKYQLDYRRKRKSKKEKVNDKRKN